MTALSHHTVAQVESTLCALETILTGTELEAQLRQFCGELGFGFFIYRRESYGNGRKIHSKAHARDQLPDAWRTRYHKRNYHQLDPVVTGAPDLGRRFSGAVRNICVNSRLYPGVFSMRLAISAFGADSPSSSTDRANTGSCPSPRPIVSRNFVALRWTAPFRCKS